MRKLFGFTVVLILSSILYAESVTCENDNGSCIFNEDGSYECLCSEDSWGEGTGIAGTSDPSGDVTMPTQEECLETVDEMCALPEGAVVCENPAGECVVMEDGGYWCDCYDGSSSGGGSSEPGGPGEEPSVDPEETDSEETSSGVDGDSETEPSEYETCESDNDCNEGFFCMDGYCVFKDEDEPEKETPECETLLKETCGTEAPDLNKICSEEALEFCADIFNLLSKKCDGEEIPADVIEEVKEGVWNDFAEEIVDCCDEYEYAKDEMKILSDCLEKKECEECVETYGEAIGEENDYGDSANQAEGDTADSGDSANEDDGNGEEGSQTSEEPKDSESDSSDGCSLLIL